MQTLRSIATLTRLESSLLVFLAVFVPVLSRTHSWVNSLKKAAPILFIGICTFIANNIDDLEGDRINHPERPLPRGTLSTTVAVVLYFLCLAAALLTIRNLVEPSVSSLYYVLITLSISYSYVKEFLPSFKSLYVAGLTSLPIWIASSLYPEANLHLVALSVLFFALGRELAMDLVDKEGDVKSHLHKLDPSSVILAAFCFQGIGLLLLLRVADGPAEQGVWLATALLSVYGLCWWNKDRRATIRLMKIQLFIGLYFLL